MKVIFVLHSHRSGGAERHLLQLMQGLSAAGVDCIYAGPLDGWLGEQLGAAGFHCEHIPYHGRFDLVSLARLVALIRREKPDLVHGHLTRGAHYAGWAARLAKVPGVATAHSTNAGKHFGRAQRIIAVSDAVRRFLVDCGYPGELLRTVHHGVPDYAAQPHLPREALRASLKLNGAPVLAMVARFEPAKGHDIALRALAGLKVRQWNLVLAGALDTRWAEEMKLLAAQLGIEERVRFAGHRDDVASIYASADILLAPSRREALSLTLLEAAAFGLPIVAADVGGIGEAVADGETGLLVPPEDPAALAEAIGRLLDDADLRRRMGKAGRERYEKRFSLESMVRGTCAVYREVAAGGNA
ncbi:glycosyltransferase family 4 protein [Noviherbaspirillum massiliense]|uniref:glycosyltransferase family 4 protein n=1 Tax=Noviherbaspirillum massiliense TaxID=1465823 RepID=UPI0002E3FE02|nr:glycosyltransferase family 4 protein [Noviherbaspirillum massiliense]